MPQLSRALTGRPPLTTDEAREVMNIARRITTMFWAVPRCCADGQVAQPRGG